MPLALGCGMAKARATFQLPPDLAPANLLVSSSFGGPWPGLEPDELHQMLDLTFQRASFSEIGLVAFSLRPNAFDLIVQAPAGVNLTKKEMLRRFEEDASPVTLATKRPLLKKGDTDAWAQLRSRFGSVSLFLKDLKQTVTQRYHTRRNTRGRLWDTRFQSAYLEAGHATRVVATWLDHAPCRELGIKRPTTWPWVTCGAAHGGDERSQRLLAALHSDDDESTAWPGPARAWRRFIDAVPENLARHNKDKKPLTRREFMLTETTYFRGTVAIGSHDFVERVFEHNRHQFGSKRETGARFVVGQNDGSLFAMRNMGDLRKA